MYLVLGLSVFHFSYFILAFNGDAEIDGPENGGLEMTDHIAEVENAGLFAARCYVKAQLMLSCGVRLFVRQVRVFCRNE